MRPDEFRQALSLLPAALHDRVLPLHRHVFRTGCPQCQRIGDTVALALTAAHYERLASAGQLLDHAVRLAAGHGVACRPQPDQERGRAPAGRRTAVSATDVGGDGRAAGPGYAAGVGRSGLRARGAGRSGLRARGAGRSDASRVRRGGPATVPPRRTASGPRGSSQRLPRTSTG
ncbi:hypothetical protein [Micromonospora sp. RP3T]|uniref:hypothetical protein n=1 Tax=Micromonospora sp. RP3T TaxID=2135446 RepID=UPI000D1569F5|nr:hypothetical protein [Micromonospora sp. RP3T]PTA46080.1 hypothetical protein C8054_11525 [Micromonospora sp. RP3T]